MSLRTEIVTSAARFDALGPAWDRLWRGTGRSVFQSHGWIRAWLTAQPPGEGPDLLVGLCWDGDDLVAAIPGAISRRRGLRVLEWAAKACSDYCDALAWPPGGPGLAMAWRAMAGAGDFHVAYLSHVRPGATIRLLAGSGSDRPVPLRPSRRADQTLQVRSRGLTGAAWFRTLNKKARNNHTRGKRIIGEMGALSVVIGDGRSGRDDAIFERMIELKRQWLAATGQRSVVLDHDACTLRHLFDYLRSCSCLQVFRLECDGVLVAGLVSVVQERQVAAFFSAFDPRFDRASPGTLAIVEQLVWAFDRGLPEVDFLCGDEPYKFRFADARTELASFVGARTLLGRGALLAGEQMERLRGPAGAAVSDAVVTVSA